MNKQLDQIEVYDFDSFVGFWVLYAQDFKDRGISWSGHCMYGFLDLFPESIYETIESTPAETKGELSWKALAEIFIKFRTLQMDT